MSGKQPYRPWGEVSWAMGLSDARRWQFFGCIGVEERSVTAIKYLYDLKALEGIQMLRIIDTVPENSALEEEGVNERIKECEESGISFRPMNVDLGAPLQNEEWRKRLSFPTRTSLCLDVSSMPKRFFFTIIKAALKSSEVRDLMVLYSKPIGYPNRELSSDPEPWATMTGFMCDDPDKEDDAASNLIVGAGFAVGGLRDHLEGREGDGIRVKVLIPFPTQPWKSVSRSWESARTIEESLVADPVNARPESKPCYYRVGAVDTSTAFETLLRITREGTEPAALAPLGPKPMSVAMCLLASQRGHFPVHYAQPKTYALDYSLGCEKTYGYWIKHDGENLYALKEG